MLATGYLFLSVNAGPVVSIPVRVDTDRITMEVWFGHELTACEAPEARAVIEGVLTGLSSQRGIPGGTE